MNIQQNPHQMETEHITRYAWIRCAIPRFNPIDPTFTIELHNGRLIEAPMSRAYAQELIKAQNGYPKGVCVMLEGQALFENEKRLIEFKSIEKVKVLELPNIARYIDQLKALKDGWLDGEGIAPSELGLDWLKQKLDEYYPADLPQPYLYPTPEGGVQIEWSLNRDEFSIDVEIDLNTYSAEWHKLNTRNDAYETRVLDLKKVDEWQWIVKRIRLFSKPNLA